jgi:transcriptional regulator GlxA family with amidase domain
MAALLRDAGLQALADSAAAVLVHAPERQRLAGRIAAAAGGTRIGPGALERARRWLEERTELPYDLNAVAQAAATSPRSLLRHFRAAHGHSPLQYLHQLRATRARMLLETTYLGIDAIAEACGYRDAAMFRRIFRAATGLTPSDYRDRFRLRTPRRDWGRDMPR